jgi:hypothetical protein
VPSRAPRRRHAPASRPCRFVACVRLQPDFLEFLFPEIRSSGNTARNHRRLIIDPDRRGVFIVQPRRRRRGLAASAWHPERSRRARLGQRAGGRTYEGIASDDGYSVGPGCSKSGQQLSQVHRRSVLWFQQTIQSSLTSSYVLNNTPGARPCGSRSLRDHGEDASYFIQW